MKSIPGIGVLNITPLSYDPAWKREFLCIPTRITEEKWAWLRFVYVKEAKYKWHDGSMILEYAEKIEDVFLENL